MRNAVGLAGYILSDLGKDVAGQSQRVKIVTCKVAGKGVGGGRLEMKRGDVVTVALPGAYGKPRPALIVQSDLFDEHPSVTKL